MFLDSSENLGDKTSENDLQKSLSSDEVIENEQNTENGLNTPLVDIFPRPTCRLYLTECDGKLIIEPRFSYQLLPPLNRDIEFNCSDASQDRIVPVTTEICYIVFRSKAREHSLLTSLLTFGLMRYQFGSYTPHDDQRKWIEHYLPELITAGIELFGHLDLIHSRVRYSVPRLSISIVTTDESCRWDTGTACRTYLHGSIPLRISESHRRVFR